MDTAQLIVYLKEQGLTPSEIRFVCSTREYGKLMTLAIYDFDSQYNDRKIDGFPDSSIAVLEKHYGKRLKSMKFDTLCSKVHTLQRCLTESPDEEQIAEAVKYYLS